MIDIKKEYLPIIGAIFGDIAGSYYENLGLPMDENFDCKKLIQKTSQPTDDTIATIALIDSILNPWKYGFRKNRRPAKALKTWVRLYPDADWGTIFKPWGMSNSYSKHYKSGGNGAVMRLAGLTLIKPRDMEETAKRWTQCSHNVEESLQSAELVARFFESYRDIDHQKLIRGLLIDWEILFGEKAPNPRECIKNRSIFPDAKRTIALSLRILQEAKSFEEAILMSIKANLDTDTQACVTGMFAAVMFPMDDFILSTVAEKIDNRMEHVLTRIIPEISDIRAQHKIQKH